jgi:YD repeat-containing protein
MNRLTLRGINLLRHLGAAALMAATLPAAAASYSTETFHYNDDETVNTYAFDRNASGTVAGYYYDSEYAAHSYLRNADGSFTDIAPKVTGEDDLSDTFALSINDSGLVAGYTTVNGWPQGWIYDPARNRVEEVRYPGANSTYVQKINNDGTVVGTAFKYYGRPDPVTGFQDFVGFGFIYRHHRFTTVRYPGMPFTYLYGINNDGLAAGYYVDDNMHNYVYTKPVNGNVFTSMDLYSDVGGALVFGVNSSGDLCGMHGNASGDYIGFTYDADTGVTEEFLVGPTTVPFSIKDDGSLIGWSNIKNEAGSYITAGFIATPTVE